jgi:xylulokinase
LWSSIIAAVLDLPLERTAVDAGAAYGAALLGGVAGGVWPDVATAAAECVRVTSRIDPDPALVEAYAAERAGFEALYPALRAMRGDGT